MGVYLVTGQPGHGKTAYGLDKAFQWQKEGRKIYANGVKDLDYGKADFTYLDDPTKWEQLPDGSVVLLDECYTIFPNRNPGAKVPDHVEAMARHRHRGFDFILIAQQGLQLDPFLRGLYEEHVHVRQTSIMKSKTKLKRWNMYQGNVQGACNDIVDWVRPKYVFDYYTSTTLVTTRRQIPTWIRNIGIGVVLLAVVLFWLRWHFQSKIAGFEAEHKALTAKQGATPTALGGTTGAGGVAVTRAPLTPLEYAQAHRPRIASMPWTAPIYDQRPVVSNPQVFCIASNAGIDGQGKHHEAGCRCMTEQGTRYVVPPHECRFMAENGPAYNPYKMPPTELAATLRDQLNTTPAADAPLPSLTGTVLQTKPRSLGTMPENEPYKSESFITAPAREGVM
ncbi:zonular occludens toxin domain-containing protein [Xanthomonas fragariae]|uniref:Filamentous phage Cf1c related protein n=1 Tax=Xanthomonas fragariae TaxID=48664 RepID=A0A1Y6H6X1_9XANT|nr:zonular occludens toxin domain-containing protein [Xanthomonas fragariae]AOD14964.1 zonular occludens toxin [Xanthomonas fragariae]AOD18361.1 zonular occludens toxin [Xanthomonas fragariae]MBL9220878.1 zonular occludens toxin [Xanthomonas fragariae]MEA5220720.1 zonular occludens toxin domain-containing protein [Xanthomonas fragariae]MEA5250552.1 zonular occludens toxin domain-containing protein [Xanthomonas fragariae]